MLRALTSLAALALFAGTAASAEPSAPSQVRLRSNVEMLVSFGTRHTLSSEDDPVRGIGAARRWVEAEFRNVSAACNGCLTMALPETMVSGDRLPAATRIVDVVAIQRGSERPDEVVIVQSHIDSRVSDVMDATSDAPGANDDGSGTALVLEAARLLSHRKFPATIVYAVLSGEEQGLYGGKLMADYAHALGWTVKAVLNNDIVGSSRGSDGLVDRANVRVFSEGPRGDATDALRSAASRFGGENDSPSRNLSRYVAGIAASLPGGIAVRQIWRADRMGRGGDQLPFQAAGIPAIRFSVAIEDYDHQHQDLREQAGIHYGDTVDQMDFAYLARVTRLNVAVLDALARSPMPPVAAVQAAVSTDTTLKWQHSVGAGSYRIYRRATDASTWGRPYDYHLMLSGLVPRGGEEMVRQFKGVRGDDWFFGVSAIAADGAASPVASALPGGQFAPLPKALDTGAKP